MMRSGYDRLLMGSPLRRSRVSKAIAAALLVILAFATLVQLVVFTGMPPGLSGVFLPCARSLKPARSGAPFDTLVP
jgi:hypothetical protein